jgi:hypothetical protein
MAVDIDDDRIVHCIFEVWLIRAGFKKLCKYISTTPIAEATGCNAPVSKMLWEITPGEQERTIQRTVSIKSRLSLQLRLGSVGLRRQYGAIFAHWASVRIKRSIKGLNHIKPMLWNSHRP